MKAIILAAGCGRRLGLKKPKAIVELWDKKTIFDLQVEKVRKYIAEKDIYVVVGYKAWQVMKAHPELTYIYNPRYSETNTSKSLLRGLQHIQGENVLWMNGDVVFEEEILPLMLKAQESCMLVDDKKCGQEEVKYKTDQYGFISEISKEVKSPAGEALGINMIIKEDLDIMKNQLTLVDDNDYFEKAIENMIKREGIRIKPVYVGNYFCHEIDFLDDLQYVREHFQSKIKLLSERS